ncbi:MAG: DHH family phosphoesterase [Elusimicrobiota bacterium]
MEVTEFTAGEKAARELLERLDRRGKKPGTLLILTHDHPDPDGIASAWALAHLVHARCGARTRIAYGGVIGRRENRMMVKSLAIPAHPLRKSDLECSWTAVVDSQPPFKNNRFPANRHPDILIDHHPRSARTQADFLLIDKTVGATSTILVEMLAAAGTRVPTRLATALVYGIGSETQNLGREAGPRDVSAYLAILPKANAKVLWRIVNPPRPTSFFQTIARGIRNAFICRRTIGVHLRELPNPDRVALMADFLLSHERMRWSIVTGRYNGRLHVSVRTNNPSEDAGRLLGELLGGRHRGGGHRTMAGGSVVMGRGASEEKWRKAEEGVVSAFLKRCGAADASRRVHPFRVVA